MKTQHMLGACRFLATLGHLICILLLFSTYKVNVEVGLSDAATDTDRLLANQAALSGLLLNIAAITVSTHDNKKYFNLNDLKARRITL